MNRIILIGNGFDLAHGLATSYKSFIDKYWEEKIERVKKEIVFDESRLAWIYSDNEILIITKDNDFMVSLNSSLRNNYSTLVNLNNSPICNNDILEKISFLGYSDWVDIEAVYYHFLLKSMKEEKEGEYEIALINEEFKVIQDALEAYLIEISQKEIHPHQQIKEIIFSSFIDKDLSLAYKKKETKDYRAHNTGPDSILLLNFNYTDTQRYYEDDEVADIEVRTIHIHGELNNPENPIIFGYGDEMDDEYKTIEKQVDNEYLEHVKSIKYLETDNYRRLMEFAESDNYQIFIFGHSCGNSDRTLLNKLFENENCVSIKPYYYQYIDKKDGKTKNNYSDIVRNISRNFNDKTLFRDKVVNKTDCHPLL